MIVMIVQKTYIDLNECRHKHSYSLILCMCVYGNIRNQHYLLAYCQNIRLVASSQWMMSEHRSSDYVEIF